MIGKVLRSIVPSLKPRLLQVRNIPTIAKIPLELEKIDRSISLAKNWLLHSGIQNPNGGVNGWYDVKRNKYPFEYPEINGYFITEMCDLYRSERDNIFIERAKLAADWVIKEALHPLGGVMAKKYIDKSEAISLYSFEGGLLWSFDTATDLFGFVNLYEITKDSKYLSASQRILKFLDMMKNPDSLFAPIYNPERDEKIEFTEDREKWSRVPGSYQTKFVLGLLGYRDVCGMIDRLFFDTAKTARQLCEAALGFQRNDGAFCSHRDVEKIIYTHALNYTLEGLLYGGLYFNESRFSDAGVSGVKWLLNNQLKEGEVARIYAGKSYKEGESSDIIAQAIRLGLLAIGMGRLDISYLDNINRAISRLLTFQNMNEEIEQKGGFNYGIEYSGETILHVNSWATMFALQALLMYKQFMQGEDLDMKFFV